MRSLRSPLILLISLFIGAEDPVDKVDYNARVVAFARSKIGEKVGDGDCSTLVQEALRDAGAKVLLSPAADGEYLWGEPRKSLKDAQPGDVLQFEKVVFRGRRRKFNDDVSAILFETKTSLPHHSAIVTAVGPRGRTLTMLHQNGPGPDGKSLKIVQETTLVMSELQKGGSLKAYRPVAP